MEITESSRKPLIIPVAGGKGGIGKSAIAINLGMILSLRGVSVVLIDLDLGGSNLYSMMGMKLSRKSIGSFLNKEENSLEELLLETPYDNLQLISGDALLPGTANLPWWFKRKILEEVPKLPSDIVIIDLGAGTAYNILDFFLISEEGLIVTTPEPTSLLNTYSFIKNAYYRRLLRLFPAKSKERNFILQWASQPNSTIQEKSLYADFDNQFPQSIETLAPYEFWNINLILNEVHTQQERKVIFGINEAVKKNLNTDLKLMGVLPEDPVLRESILDKTPLFFIDPSAPFCQGLTKIVDSKNNFKKTAE